MPKAKNKEQNVLDKINTQRESTIDIPENTVLYVTKPQPQSKHKMLYKEATLLNKDENTEPCNPPW
ncbi:hypothetical protein NQ314_003044 [Rhamnusium bicolor]|uniref:Uncharacterized protein n=1 Tax=Rhamnusium bicolor TaxID=1586634 RepID=A0AAV8ZNF9_9CUCU|nr:hypothetical protein NQ314_003044 [Rhamnusium bicolor]